MIILHITVNNVAWEGQLTDIPLGERLSSRDWEKTTSPGVGLKIPGEEIVEKIFDHLSCHYIDTNIQNRQTICVFRS